MKNIKEYKYDIYLIIIAFFAGLGIFVTKGLTSVGVATFPILTYRFLISGSLIYVYYRIKGDQADEQTIRVGIGAGVLLFMVYTLQTEGLQHLASYKVATYASLIAVTYPLVRLVIKKEKMLPNQIIGSFILISTVSIINKFSFANFNMNDGFVIISAFINAFLLVYLASNKHIPYLQLTSISFLTSGALSFFVAIFKEQSFVIPPSGIPVLLYLIIFSTVIFYTVRNELIEVAPGFKVAFYTGTESVWTIIIASIFGKPSLQLYIVIALIIIAVYIINYHHKKKEYNIVSE